MSYVENQSPRDRYRINMSDEHEVRYWTRALGVGREKLAEAVEQVGAKVSDVRVCLRNQVSRTGPF